MCVGSSETFLQKVPDFIVIGLSEVEVPLTDGGKRLRHSCANDLVSRCGELGTRLARAHWNRDNDA